MTDELAVEAAVGCLWVSPMTRRVNPRTAECAPYGPARGSARALFERDISKHVILQQAQINGSRAGGTMASGLRNIAIFL